MARPPRKRLRDDPFPILAKANRRPKTCDAINEKRRFLRRRFDTLWDVRSPPRTNQDDHFTDEDEDFSTLKRAKL